MGRKCAVVGCKSGYMPTKKQNLENINPTKCSVFKFPDNENLCAEWLKVSLVGDWFMSKFINLIFKSCK